MNLTTNSAEVALVIPCYNEAARFDILAFSRLAALGNPMRLIFVDDGSKDETLAALRGFVVAHPQISEVLSLGENEGKAEAVRQGMLRALETGYVLLGFADADMATPPMELSRLAARFRKGNSDVLLGARMKLLGREIKRYRYRRYLGRAFTTVASAVLGFPIYDMQCGAKFFRASEALVQALSEPFASRWSFDVELLGRLLRTKDGVAPVSIERIREEPLERWIDVQGSKLNPIAAIKSVLELGKIAWRLRRR